MPSVEIFQVQKDSAASRRKGWAWEEQNRAISFHERDPEEEPRGACSDFSLTGNTP